MNRPFDDNGKEIPEGAVGVMDRIFQIKALQKNHCWPMPPNADRECLTLKNHCGISLKASGELEGGYQRIRMGVTGNPPRRLLRLIVPINEVANLIRRPATNVKDNEDYVCGNRIEPCYNTIHKMPPLSYRFNPDCK